MGKLVTRANLEPDPSWYFSDARYSWEGKKWIYQFPSRDFLYYVAIHNDDLAKYNDRKIAIRRWIEHNVNGTVIIDELDKRYRVYYSEKHTWQESYEQSNTWWVFYFEHEENALLFKLTFSEYVSKITDLHPKRNDTYEKTSYCTSNQ